MWTIILNALVKEIETNPSRVFDLLENILNLLQKHPEAVTAVVKMLPVNNIQSKEINNG